MIRASLRTLLLLALVVSLAAAPARAQRVGEPPPLLPEPVVAALAAELSGTNARHVVQELSLHHRMRGSRGFRAAAESLRARLEAYGLEEVKIWELPADGEVFYGTQRSRPAWDAGFAELWEQRRVGESWVDDRLVASWQERPITLAQDSASGSASAELVDVGAGTSEADYAGKDVAGKLVLVSSQPGAAAPLGVGRFGAAGIVSYAQNQKSAWWGEDETLVRWGHLATFGGPETFAFMVSVDQAQAWQARLAAGETVRLRARVEAGRHPGAYSILTAVVPGRDPAVASEEVVFSCHLDHQRPGANDNASGCAAILEVARSLAKLVAEGKVPAPRRTLRFLWPPEIEGTIALLNAKPELARRALAVIHMDMVGGEPHRTKAIFHVTRSPTSLPTVVNDVAEAFGRFANSQTYAFSATGEADYPLVDPEGSRQALQARFADFSMGSDHQVWAEGSFRVPAIYFNDWPDRYIHTHADEVGNIDATKLLRAAFLGAASAYGLADLGPGDLPALLAVWRRHALARAGEALARAERLNVAGEAAEAENLLAHQLAFEKAVVASIEPFAALPGAEAAAAEAFLADLAHLLGSPRLPEPPRSGPGARVCGRAPEPKGPLSGFGYSYLDDRLEKDDLPRPALLSYRGLWGGGGEYAYEALNLVDDERSVGEIRDALAAAYGPVPLERVAEFLATLEEIGLLACAGTE